MRKSNVSSRKAASNDAKSQQKLSLFFSKGAKSAASKSVVCDSTDERSISHARNSTVNKKRKITDLETEDLSSNNKRCNVKQCTTDNDLVENEVKYSNKESQLNKHVLSENEPSNDVVSNSEDHISSLDFNMADMDELDDLFDQDWSATTPIDLSTFQRCQIIAVNKDWNAMTLTVEHIASKVIGSVTCLGFWKDVEVEDGDVVTIKARKQSEQWVVDNEHGFLVTNPDTLVSSTTVVGGLFCSRRAVLTEKFRKIESLPYFSSDQSAMTIGILLHELLQKALSNNIYNISDITKLMNSMLDSRETVGLLYASDLSMENCRKQMDVYLPKIVEFIEHYVKGKSSRVINNMKDNFKGQISQIQDIEENIWLPALGIKGKIDVTVEVNINRSKQIMPLEIKTGRPSFSLEHKGQIILYIMMMALTGRNVDTGLLLYLRENSMREIRGSRSEQRDIVLLRNTLARYFTKNQLKGAQTIEPNGVLSQMALPPPINHHNACARCPYNSLCCAYLTKDDDVQLSESHNLTAVSKDVLGEVTPTHIDYIFRWIALLQLEEHSATNNYLLKDIWTLTPEEREAKGTCISNLKVIGKVTEQCGRYQHVFVRTDKNMQNVNSDMSLMNFTENDIIIVSTNTRINVSAGFIMHFEEDSISVLLDRNITRNNIHAIYCIDKYSSPNLLSCSLANVGGLLGNDKICTKLRSIIIDRQPATFIEKLPRSIVSQSVKILCNLNQSQQRAVLKAIAANDYILIKGMPGTGKTQTVVALVKLLHKVGLSVLITSHTHSAVDNILLKLVEEHIDILRLGSSASVHPALRQKCEEYVTANCNSPEALESIYNSKNIVGVTCYGAHHMLLGKRTFDVCIVDESAQVMLPVILRPLYNAQKFILAGDPDQLPPIVKSNIARKHGANESLFVRLDSPQNTVLLEVQYRMNKTIMNLANDLTYCNKLKAGNKTIENATFSGSCSETTDKKWMNVVLSSKLDDSVIVLNTGNTYGLKKLYSIHKKYPESDEMYCNIWEASIVVFLMHAFTQAGASPENIGVIAPYNAHVKLLKKLLNKNIEVNTVDKYQGRDKHIIVYTCAQSLSAESAKSRDFEILRDHQRLTVAITRAKLKLIIVADKDTVTQYAPFKKIFDSVQKQCVVNLNDAQNNFDWEKVIACL